MPLPTTTTFIRENAKNAAREDLPTLPIEPAVEVETKN
jgi:hypothetical protein